MNEIRFYLIRDGNYLNFWQSCKISDWKFLPRIGDTVCTEGIFDNYEQFGRENKIEPFGKVVEVTFWKNKIDVVLNADFHE